MHSKVVSWNVKRKWSSSGEGPNIRSTQDEFSTRSAA
jgi:hypothetical protein